MTRPATRKQTPSKTSRKASPPAPAKLNSLMRKAQQTGRAMGRTGARLADPLVQSIQKEDSQTLAKMALAALAPRLANYALRIVLRNPMLAIAGVVLVAAVVSFDTDAEAT